MPDAEYLYACDQKWWEHHLPQVDRVFGGKRYKQYRDPPEKVWAEKHGITAIHGESKPGLGRDRLHFGHNSGYQAINLAYLMGATKIVLLGYDMQWTGGKKHWFGDHPTGFANGNFEEYVKHFTALAEDLKAEGVEVINCSRETALKQFPRAELKDALTTP